MVKRYSSLDIGRYKHYMRIQTMKKLNITKEAFEKSNYFKNKYGELEYVSESGKVFKTSKGKLIKFKESTKRFGKKFKESVGDISTDPDYVCPYCGSEI